MLKVMVMIVVIQGTVGMVGYFIAINRISDTFGELLLVVAEDNCLDNTVPYNGTTTYEKFENKLLDINSRDTLVKYEADAIDVEYTNRDTAPQKGSLINCKLTGYYTAELKLFGGMPIRHKITREDKVLGTKYYRDR